jgi:CheY-like chemotaxis protein
MAPESTPRAFAGTSVAYPGRSVCARARPLPARPDRVDGPLPRATGPEPLARLEASALDQRLSFLPEAREARLQRELRVLLVEDDDGLREAVAHGLRKAGYLVSEAATAREALERTRAEVLDVAVIDVILPDAGGLGLANRLREREGLQALPILFVTAMGPAMVKDSLFPSPVLYKPFTYRQLVASVRDVLRR